MKKKLKDVTIQELINTKCTRNCTECLLYNFEDCYIEKLDALKEEQLEKEYEVQNK